MHKFTEETTKVIKTDFEIDFGTHYFKIVEDDELHLYKIEIIDKPKVPWDKIHITKVFRAYEKVYLSIRENEDELPFRIRYFLSGKNQGKKINEKEFNSELYIALKYFNR